MKKTMFNQRLYNIWSGIKRRCYDEKCDSFKYYGGRGVKVCAEWIEGNSYHNFKDWALQNGYKDNLTIDRIDVNGDYEPSNCRWISLKEQANNRRNTIIIENKDGVKKSLAQWCEVFNISHGTALDRYNKGYSFDKIFQKHSMLSSLYLVDGEYKTIAELSRIYNVNHNTLRDRVKKYNMSIEEALTKPNKKQSKKKISKNNNKYLYKGQKRSASYIASDLNLNVRKLRKLLDEGNPLNKSIELSQKQTPKQFSYNGKMLTLSQISKETGIPSKLLSERMRNGKTLDEAIAYNVEPQFTKNKHLYKGELLSLSEIARRNNINARTFRGRIQKGMTIEEAIKTENKPRVPVNRVKVAEYDKNGNIVRVFQSVKIAARELKISKPTLLKWIKNENKINGYQYRYID